jgi:CRISPR-associated endonuclease Cas1
MGGMGGMGVMGGMGAPHGVRVSSNTGHRAHRGHRRTMVTARTRVIAHALRSSGGAAGLRFVENGCRKYRRRNFSVGLRYVPGPCIDRELAMIATTTVDDSNDSVVVVEGYGADISVNRGHLVIKDGFASEGTLREIYFPRGRCEVERIIVRAPAGNISIASLDWCHRMGIAIAIVGSDSRIINCLVPDGSPDGPLKRAQAVCGMTDDAVELAHWLLQRKFDSQIHAVERPLHDLGLFGGRELERARALRDLRACASNLSDDRTLDRLLVREGKVAQAYWQLLSGVLLPWPDWTHKRIPAHWRRVWPRESGGRDRVRDARDPFNAILNYCYTLLEVEARVACVNVGLDPNFGLLHVDERLRESFVYDLLEPLRASVDVMAFELIRRQGLRPHMFIELRDGVVRLDPGLTKVLAKVVMPRLRKPLMGVATAFAARLRRIELPYRLARFTKSESPDPRPGYRRGRIPPTNPGQCEYCKQPISKKGLKFCNRPCYLRHSVETRQPIKLAQAKLAALRQSGISPGHGGAAALLRGAKIAESNRRRAMNLSATERRALKSMQARVRYAQKKAERLSNR